MRSAALIPVLALVALLLTAPAAQAQTAPASEQGSWWSQGTTWVLEKQRALHRQLTRDFRALASEKSAAAAWTLITASFLYGVFHAAGPGHGKMVLSAYLLSHPDRMRRGMGLAAASALAQGLVAIVLVYGLIMLAGWLPRDAAAAVAWSERLSFVILTLIGAVLTLRAGSAGIALLRHRGHTHTHGDGEVCGCGHAHGPNVEQVEKTHDLRTAVGVVLSIGLRPCSGAVLVLVFAHMMGLAWAGVAAVMAMSAGTAMAVGGLAALVVGARNRLGALGGDSLALRLMGHSVALILGGLVLLGGGSLLAASFMAPAHPLM